MSGELPDGWVLARLDDLIGPGGLMTDGDWVESKDQDPNGEVRLIQLADVGDGLYRDRSSRFLTLEKAEQLSCTLLEQGDVLVSRMADPLGRACIFPGDAKRSATVVDVCVIRTGRGGPRHDWLVAAINSPEARARINRLASGTTRKRVSRKKLATVRIGVPPLNEQRRIVEKIEALMARSRRAKEALDAIPPLLERFRQSVLAAAFRGDLTADWRAQNPDVEPVAELLARTPVPPRPKRMKSRSIAVIPGAAGLSVGDPGLPLPTGWEWVPLIDVARMESGHTPSRRHPEWWGGEVPWVGLRDAGSHHGTTIRDTREHTNDEGLANSAARLLPAGTVCLSRTGTIGYTTVMGRPMATSQDFVNWVCTEALDREFLKFLFMAEHQALHRFSRQTTNIATIYYPELLALHVALPPHAEQREIARQVEQRIGEVDRMVTEFEASIGIIPRLERSILGKAFRGELVSQDASDEPAAVLLDRLRAAGAAKPEKKPRRKRRG